MRRWTSLGILVLCLACGGDKGPAGGGDGAAGAAAGSGGGGGAGGRDGGGAGSGGAQGGATGASVSLAMMPAASASALCAKIATCCSAEEKMMSILPPDRAGCERVLLMEHQAQVQGFEQILAMGRASYDGAALAACLKAIADQTCPEARMRTNQNVPSICPQMIAGKVAMGGACRDSGECMNGWCVDFTPQRDGRCMGPRKKVGAACEDSDECESRNCDLFDGMCAPPEPDRLCE